MVLVKFCSNLFFSDFKFWSSCIVRITANLIFSLSEEISAFLFVFTVIPIIPYFPVKASIVTPEIIKIIIIVITSDTIVIPLSLIVKPSPLV